jgi:hypothetical protein
MASEFDAAKLQNAALLARHIALLLDGSFATVLLHRDAAYMEAAGLAAHKLVSTAMREAKSKARLRAISYG